jgi:hypothetical protein
MSSASCSVDDVQGIIFGGISSRFWLLRKHFNSLSTQELKDLPFYCWECVTLQLTHRDVDIVIRDQKEMDKLLTYLVHNLRTMDGKRDSANKILAAIYKDSDRKVGNKKLSQVEIIASNEHHLFQKVMMKYKVMRIRAKISFMALQKRMTIYELFISTIQSSYRMLQKEGLIPQETWKI